MLLRVPWFIYLFILITSAACRKQGGMQAGEVGCGAIATSWLTVQTVPLLWLHGGGQPLMSDNYMCLLRLRRQETPLIWAGLLQCPQIWGFWWWGRWGKWAIMAVSGFFYVLIYNGCIYFHFSCFRKQLWYISALFFWLSDFNKNTSFIFVLFDYLFIFVLLDDLICIWAMLWFIALK